MCSVGDCGGTVWHPGLRLDARVVRAQRRSDWIIGSCEVPAGGLKTSSQPTAKRWTGDESDGHRRDRLFGQLLLHPLYEFQGDDRTGHWFEPSVDLVGTGCRSQELSPAELAFLVRHFKLPPTHHQILHVSEGPDRSENPSWSKQSESGVRPSRPFVVPGIGPPGHEGVNVARSVDRWPHWVAEPAL